MTYNIDHITQVDSSNWNDIVGHDTRDTTDTSVDVLYLTSRIEPKPDSLSNIVIFQIERERGVELTLTEAEAMAEVDRLLTSFPPSPYEMDEANIGMLKTANLIAVQSRRGAGNHRYKNALYYRGSNMTDGPIIVVSNSDGKHAVFVHPDFAMYGFTLQGE